jgi:3-deoxy-D-manno-octulosonic-acid transferase
MAGALLVRTGYTTLGVAITPALKLWLKRRIKRGKEDASRQGERFGFSSIPRPQGTLVWLHAASVGEVQSVLTLVRALLDAQPTIHLLITTGTVTSAALVAQQHLARTFHQFVPVDTYPAVRRFLQHWRPDIAVWVESEFWPQLLWQVQAQHVPMLLVNARISQKTYENWQQWPATIRSMLHGFCGIYAGSTEDATRLRALGASDVQDVGNLKFDAAPLAHDEAMLQKLLQQSHGRPIFLAASTHANEEHMIAETHRDVAQQFPTLLTIIVPRHAARGASIAADLRGMGYTLAQRSAGEMLTANTDIYLADTMGELGLFYRAATIVFMGGSLIAHGGQNPLEAARLDNAILTGPHTHNFSAIIARFVAVDAIQVVANANALAEALKAMLADVKARNILANNAMHLVEQSRGASSIILQKLSELITRVTP